MIIFYIRIPAEPTVFSVQIDYSTNNFFFKSLPEVFVDFFCKYIKILITYENSSLFLAFLYHNLHKKEGVPEETPSFLRFIHFR